ncbi:transglutaminase domain-containing protein [Streptomyces sp. NPDC048291]|uniref:transglutaminase domain-containing protein n=1 Tax=Streptomyces sp. NPDC048291 TaxID=3365530 RepID=UPI00371013C5
MVNETIDYAQQSPITRLTRHQHGLLDGLPRDPLSICASAQNLVVSPQEAIAAGIPENRIKEQGVRPVRDLLAILTELWPERLERWRPLEVRVVGTTRHSAVLACSMLRAQGYATRVRCGYLAPISGKEPRTHWTTEWWSESDGRWIRMEFFPAISGSDRRSGQASIEFVTAGEAWQLCRSRSPGRSPIGLDIFGAGASAEISADVVRDLAALGKLEMLPTDAWGRMTAPQSGLASAAYLNLIDVVASVCNRGDLSGIVRLRAGVDLAVPPHLVGTPVKA